MQYSKQISFLYNGEEIVCTKHGCNISFTLEGKDYTIPSPTLFKAFLLSKNITSFTNKSQQDSGMKESIVSLNPQDLFKIGNEGFYLYHSCIYNFNDFNERLRGFYDVTDAIRGDENLSITDSAGNPVKITFKIFFENRPEKIVYTNDLKNFYDKNNSLLPFDREDIETSLRINDPDHKKVKVFLGDKEVKVFDSIQCKSLYYDTTNKRYLLLYKELLNSQYNMEDQKPKAFFTTYWLDNNQLLQKSSFNLACQKTKLHESLLLAWWWCDKKNITLINQQHLTEHSNPFLLMTQIPTNISEKLFKEQNTNLDKILEIQKLNIFLYETQPISRCGEFVMQIFLWLLQHSPKNIAFLLRQKKALENYYACKSKALIWKQFLDENPEFKDLRIIDYSRLDLSLMQNLQNYYEEKSSQEVTTQQTKHMRIN